MCICESAPAAPNLPPQEQSSARWKAANPCKQSWSPKEISNARVSAGKALLLEIGMEPKPVKGFDTSTREQLKCLQAQTKQNR